jgi:aspartate kinase
MEAVLVSGVHLNPDQARITIHDLPDVPGNCSRVFNRVAQAGILVDMIVQNITSPGRAELSLTVPRSDLARAEEFAREVVLDIDAKCRVVGDGAIAILYVLGVGMRTHTGVARRMFGALAEQGINIIMINTSEVCIGVAVEQSRGEEARDCLKRAFGI